MHVIVALRNSNGKMLNPNIRDFTEWRLRFADKARERGIPIDRQKRLERAGPPPVKRWEWEMFRRMGATAPSNVVDKVLAKIRDTPTSPQIAGCSKAARSEPALSRTCSEDAGRDSKGPIRSQHGART